ncbi:MAG: acyl-CoA dehydrogenase family protein, partial [Acidobacteriota bacterium]
MAKAAIDFGNEQGMLLDIATKFFKEKVSIDDVRASIDEEVGFSAELWQEMADAGWNGLAIPEEHGGTGMGLGELVPIVERLGRSLCPSPFVSSQLAARAIVVGGSEEQKSFWLPQLAESGIGTIALFEPDGSWLLDEPSAVAEESEAGWRLSGTKTLVTDAMSADVAVVSAACDGEAHLFLVGRELIAACAPQREVIIDETRRSYRLSLDGLEVSRDARLANGASALRAVEHAALLLTSAEAAGGLAGALDVTVEYLNSRQQFGRLIGSYQALKHPTVDVLTGLERSRSHVYHAASHPDDEIALRMAKAESCDSFVFGGDRAVQFHGGFGFTYECDAQLFLRRALWCQSAFGDASYQRQVLGDL